MENKKEYSKGKKKIFKALAGITIAFLALMVVLTGCQGKINEDEGCRWTPFTTENEAGEGKKTEFVSHCLDCGKERSYSSKPSEGLLYTENEDGTLTVSGIGTCGDEFLYIPAKHNGKEISAIGENAFDGVMSIKYLYISGGVKNIGAHAFINCENLLVAAMGKGVEKMGIYAFYECLSMYAVEISETITEIEEFTFSGCLKLREIDLPSGITKLGKGSFSRCTSITEFTVPENVKTLEEHTFDACRSLCKIDLSNAQGVLPESIFAACESLESVVIPRGIHTIGVNAFIGCTSLQELYIPQGVQTINVRDGESPFYMCDKDKLTVKCEAGTPAESWAEGYDICNYIEYDDADKESEAVRVKFVFGEKYPE